MDPVSELENALGAELLRTRLLGREPPTIAQRYQVEEILGRGASGLVVAGTDVRLNRPVALKVRLVDGDSSALDEARALARLDHPNVVRVYDVDIAQVRFGGCDREAWIVSMPRVDGLSMRGWLREAPRSTADILRVLADVGRGLSAAHAERIIHRDVKPDNVLVRRDGVAQVLDFGFAVQTSSAQSELGGIRASAGTDPYMAPEARLGRTSRASDQFSLGVTLVEALTGEPRPAGAKTPPGVPSAVWRIARRATSPEPEERYADLAAMVEAMTAALAPRVRATAIPGLVAAVFVGLAALAMMRRGHAPAAAHGEPPAAVPEAAPAVMRVDAGPPVRDAGASDAAIAALFDAAVPIDASVARDAGTVRCTFRSGQYRFRAIDDSPTARQGVYVLGVDVRGGRVNELSLRRVEPMRDQLEVRRHAVRDDCTLVVEAHAENRDYTFEVAIDVRSVRGTFRTSRGAGYAGRVVPDGT